MKTLLRLLGRGIASETLKHQSAFFVWFLFLVPLAVSVITFLITLYDAHLSVVNPWRWYIAFSYRPYLFLFPLVQVLLLSHLNYLEHKNHTWKNIYVLPIPRWGFFLAKLILAELLLLLNALLFYSLVIGSGLLLAGLRPELGFQYTSYWYEALIPATKSFLASFGVAAIMYFVSYRVNSMLWSVIIGLAGYVSAFALFLHNSRPTYRGIPFAEYHPFNFSGYAFHSFGTGNHFLQMEQVYYGLLGGFLLVVIHYGFSLKKHEL